MRAVSYPITMVLALQLMGSGVAAAEEFKYYVWIDEEGIVHAEEEAPKGRDYQVRIIEDINANVVPAEEFRLYEDPPADYGSDSDDTGGDAASSEGSQTGASTRQESDQGAVEER